MRFFLVKQQSNPGKKGRVESPSRLAPSTPQSQSFVNKKGGLLLSPTLERPGKESFYWEMCYMETEMKTFKDVMEGLKVIGAGTATIALAGAAVGIGKIFSSLIHSVARSPSSSGRTETRKIQVGICLSTCLSTSEHSVQVLRVLSLQPADIIWLGLAGINNEKKTTKWKQQLTMALGGPRQRPRRRGDRSNRVTPRRRFHSWAAVGGYLRKLRFDPPPGWEASTSSRSQGEVHYDGGYFFFSLPERMNCIGDHPFVAACSSDLRIHRGPQALLS
ncbi:hypothetical protein L1987_88673 [Smallanthus sonchifolius]|nr:hypothetical protein L1987_88673 [Smallanthus sonchifolius]